MIITHLTYNEILKYFLKARFATKIGLLIFWRTGIKENIFDEWKNTGITAEIDSDYTFVEFNSEEDAIIICQKIPDSNPYTQVISHGQVIYENT